MINPFKDGKPYAYVVMTRFDYADYDPSPLRVFFSEHPAKVWRDSTQLRIAKAATQIKNDSGEAPNAESMTLIKELKYENFNLKHIFLTVEEVKIHVN